MPAPELSHRYQTAVLWAALLDADGRVLHDEFGQARVNPPTEIKVRWNDTKSEQLSPQGNKVKVDATVDLGFTVVEIGSCMWLGTIADMPGTGMIPATDVMQVITSNFTPDLKNRFVQRTVGLMRIKDTLPTVG